jgi:hypothetical protein
MELQALLGEGEGGADKLVIARIARYWLWLIVLPVGMYVFGVIIGTFLFIFIFLMIEGGVHLRWALVSAAAWAGVLAILAETVNMRWPAPILPIPGL